MTAITAMTVRSAAGVVAAALALAPPIAAQESIEEKVARMTADVSAERLRSTVERLAGFGTRHVLSRTDSDTEGTGAARAWLQARYEALIPLSGGRLTVQRQEHEVEVRRRGMPDRVSLVNIVATLRGTVDPDRVYLVGGHYDSRNSTGSDGERPAPGANDDASGTAAALEACRVMCGTPFPATLVFVAYDGEEQGLLGSRAHAEALRAAGVGVDGMITCDIVGNTLGMDGRRYDDHVRCFSYSSTGNDSPGRSLARAAAFAAARHRVGLAVKIVYRGDRYGRGGDHRSFFDQGFPAVRFTEPREDYSRQHQDVTELEGEPYGDLPQFVDFDYLAMVTRVVVATLAELASAPPPPLVTGARGARDAYDTRVFFRLPEGVEDYELVWRDTTAADWEGVVQKAQAAIEETERGLRATLPGLCLDDAVVGVRCLGADGSRSRVATPPEPDRFDLRRAGGR